MKPNTNTEAAETVKTTDSPAVAQQRLVSEMCGVIELIGCIRHGDDESANCVKIRRISDGQPLTQKEIWDVLNEFANTIITESSPKKD